MSPTSERPLLRPSMEARVQLDRVELLYVPAEPIPGCERGLVQDGVPVVVAPSRRTDPDVTHSSPIIALFPPTHPGGGLPTSTSSSLPPSGRGPQPSRTQPRNLLATVDWKLASVAERSRAPRRLPKNERCHASRAHSLGSSAEFNLGAVRRPAFSLFRRVSARSARPRATILRLGLLRGRL